MESTNPVIQEGFPKDQPLYRGIEDSLSQKWGYALHPTLNFEDPVFLGSTEFGLREPTQGDFFQGELCFA